MLSDTNRLFNTLQRHQRKTTADRNIALLEDPERIGAGDTASHSESAVDGAKTNGTTGKVRSADADGSIDTNGQDNDSKGNHQNFYFQHIKTLA